MDDPNRRFVLDIFVGVAIGVVLLLLGGRLTEMTLFFAMFSLLGGPATQQTQLRVQVFTSIQAQAQETERPVIATAAPIFTQPTLQKSEVPATREEAALKWGGQPAWLSQIAANGWVVRANLTLAIWRHWRVAYTDPNGKNKSCEDNYDPGVNGPTTVNVTVDTLCYVSGETHCLYWTIWSQSRP